MRSGLFVESTGDDFDSLSRVFVLTFSNREKLPIQIERDDRGIGIQSSAADANGAEIDTAILKGDISNMLHSIREESQTQAFLSRLLSPEEPIGLPVGNRNHPTNQRT